MTGEEQAKFAIRRLTKIVGNSVKRWNSPGGEPTVPDMSAAIQSWVNDMIKLSYHDELNSPSFSRAKARLEEAWDNRDNRKKAIRASGEFYEALESVPEEMMAPEPARTFERRTAKSLFGELAGHYLHDPEVFTDLYEIKRQLGGFSGARSAEEVDWINVNRVKSALAEIAERYETGSKINAAAIKAVRHLDMASAIKSSSRHMSKEFSNANRMIDTMGAYADIDNSPSGYKAELGRYGLDSATSAIEMLQDLAYKQPFYTPSELLPRAIKSANRIVNALSEYYDPKAARLAQSIVYHLASANNIASGSTRVKSLDMQGWTHPELAHEFNAAMARLGDLERHVNNLY